MIPRLVAALTLGLAAGLANISTTRAVSAHDTPEYEVVDGAILVFGHRLETDNPLPKQGNCDECWPIGFHRSPTGRWILIVSDVMFTANDVWLYDAGSKVTPRHLIDKRRGRHLETNWLSDRVFEVRWIGMGYSTSLLFDAANPGAGRAMDDLLLYDVERDVYVRYDYDNETSSDMIEIGSVFSRLGRVEHFPIALGGDSRVDAIYKFKSVEIAGSSVIVTHATSGEVLVSDEFSPQVLAGTR